MNGVLSARRAGCTWGLGVPMMKNRLKLGFSISFAFHLRLQYAVKETQSFSAFVVATGYRVKHKMQASLWNKGRQIDDQRAERAGTRSRKTII